MVAVFKNPKSIRASILYNERKVSVGDAKLIGEGWYGKDLHDLTLAYKVQRLEDLASRNLRSQKSALHLMLNFSVKDQLNETRLNNIAYDYLDRIGLKKQPYLVYQHFDAGHPHIHVVTTKIRPSGELINPYLQGKSMFWAARMEIEEKYGLQAPQKRQQSISRPLVPLEYGKCETESTISNIVNDVLATYKLTSLPEFNAVLSQFNVRAHSPLDHSKIKVAPWVVYQATRDGKAVGSPVKAKIIDGNPNLKNLEGLFENNTAVKFARKDSLSNRIDSVLTAGPTEAGFLEALKMNGISVILKRDTKGTLVDITYIDNLSGVVYSGNELGKEYSAAELGSRLGHFNEVLKELKISTIRAGQPVSYLSSAIVEPRHQGTHLEIRKKKQALRI